jgi:hypothetical protein
MPALPSFAHDERNMVNDLVRADAVEPTMTPQCPECGQAMPYYGGTAGFIHCGSKILYRSDGWFDDKGMHVKDDRLAGGDRRVDSEVRLRAPKPPAG